MPRISEKLLDKVIKTIQKIVSEIINQTSGVSTFRPEEPADSDDLLVFAKLLSRSVYDINRTQGFVDAAVRGGQYYIPGTLSSSKTQPSLESGWRRFKKWRGVLRSRINK